MSESPSGRAVAPLPTAAERESAVERLSAAFAHDVLSLDEFERRVTSVYGATAGTELAALTADLPVLPTSDTGSALARGDTSPMAHRVAAVFANVERAGPLEVPALLELRSVFGNLELDLRDARFGAGVTEIAIRAVLGNVEVRLPANAVVENHGSGILASFTCRADWMEGGLVTAGGPRVRITGRAVLGNVEIVMAR
jgi:hypothetical protein